MTRSRGPVTLAIDIGGSGIKAMLLDPRGRPASERLRVLTPRPATPRAVIARCRALAAELPGFDRVSIGFPGVVVDGVTWNAINLHRSWVGVPIEQRLRRLLRRPVRVANDADVQGLGVVRGRGVELVLTLGTGIGSALFLDGRLVPNLELGHHPFHKGRTYEELLGEAARRRVGDRRWNRRLRRAIDELDAAFSYRRIYLGGGNAKRIRGALPQNAQVVDNLAGLLGGIRLWREATEPARARRSRARTR